MSFDHGVASFEPTSTGVLLWTRCGGGADGVTWKVATDPELRRVVARGAAVPEAEHDFTVTVQVDGLDPGTSYWYQFEANGDLSPIGRTRTLPGPGAELVRFATVSCAHYSVAPLGVYRAVAEREVDFVLHLGDYIYEDEGSGARAHDPPATATSVEDYRRRLAQIRADPDAQALHRRHPMIAIWDDHDLADNAWRGGAKKHDHDEHGPWLDRARAAAKARQEWLPARLRDPDDPLLTWRSTQLGDLAELVLLDTRLTGRDLHAGDDGSPDLDDPDRSLLGEAQRTWAHERLLDTDRPWAVVASGVVVNEIELSWPRPLRWINAWLPNGYAVLDGRLLHDDQWDGYPSERDRLVSAIGARARRGGRTLLLSGDVHSSWAFEGPCDPGSGTPVAVEMTTPAVSSAPMGRAHYPGFWRILDRAVNRLDHVRWADVTERGYGLVELTPVSAMLTFWFVHPYAEDPGGRAIPGAVFRTELDQWPPRLRPLERPHEDPVRPDAASAPPRPDDLARLRARRWIRLALEAAGWAALAVAPVVVASLGLRRHRRRRGAG